MSYDGNGHFSINSTGQPVVFNTVISDTVFNAFTADIATGLSTAICKDGQTTPTANLPMGNFKHTGAAAASASGQYIVYGQSAASLASTTFSGTVTFTDGSTWSNSSINVLSDITGGHIVMQGSGGGYYRCTGFGITTTLQIDSIQTNVGNSGGFGGFGVVNNTNGVVLVNNATSWSAISDERKKTDLIPISNASKKLQKLRAVTGRYLTDTADKSRAFLIAQDVQSVLPEAVTENADSELLLAYTDVIPLLVAAVKELSVRVAELDGRA